MKDCLLLLATLATLAMAVGGITFTGSTGEDYAIHNHNAIVLERNDHSACCCPASKNCYLT